MAKTPIRGRINLDISTMISPLHAQEGYDNCSIGVLNKQGKTHMIRQTPSSFQPADHILQIRAHGNASHFDKVGSEVA